MLVDPPAEPLDRGQERAAQRGQGVFDPRRHFRLIAAELQLATVRSQVALSPYTDFENFTTLRPGPRRLDILTATLDQVVAWPEALAGLRQ